MKFLKKMGFQKKITQDNINQFDVIIRKGDICIDAGANVGNITAQMIDCGAKVYAFEPNPFAFAKLEQRFISNKNVVCYNKGVYSRQDKMALYFHENSHEDEVKWSTGSSLLDFKSNVDEGKKVIADIVDFDFFIKSLNQRIKLIKMDVEGVEIEIINKLLDTGTIFLIDKLVVETHEDKIPELKQSTGLLKKRIKQMGIKNIDLNWV